MTLQRLNKAPFPWFGGKSKAAPIVWRLLGDVEHYVEPFAGALGVLLERPHPCNRPYLSETINDLDGFVVNAWRAIQLHPETTAEWASWPVTEADKNARQIACLKWRTDTTLERLAGTWDWCDPQIAGFWLYGVCTQIGAFAGDGAWTADPVTGRIYKQARSGTREPGVVRNLPHLSDDGQGVNRPGAREPGVVRGLPYLGDDGRGVNHAGTREPGVVRDLPHLTNNGRGVNHAGTREPGVVRGLPHLSDDGQGVNRPGTREPGVAPHADPYEFHPVTMPELVRWFAWLAARLRHVRIVNGDWRRVCTNGAIMSLSVRSDPDAHAGIFLDPPYSNAVRTRGLYGHDDGDVADDVRAWCLANGDNPKWRIVLAGFDNENHTDLETHGWTVHEWFTAGHLTGGMGNTRQDDGDHQQHRERLWASPHCLTATPPDTDTQMELFT